MIAPDLDVRWGCFFSSDVTIMSILILVIFITIFALCTTCFRNEVKSTKERELPLSHLFKERLEDEWSTDRPISNVNVPSSMTDSQVASSLQYSSHSINDTQETMVSPHKEDEQTPRLQLPDAMHRRFNDLPPSPVTVHSPSVQMEPTMESLSEQQPRDNVLPHQVDQSNTNSRHTEHIYTLLESATGEHTYESIDSFSESLTPTTLDEDAKEQCERPGQSTGQNSPHCIITDKNALYAKINRESQKSTESQISPVTLVMDEDDESEDVAPPVPKRLFE